MINFKQFKIKDFLELDLRWKLKRIGKHLGINIYPNIFEWKGIKGLYSKFIFFLLFQSLASKKRKFVLEEIQRITKKRNYKKKFLISPPSSGSNYLRGILSSYCELYYNIGNGVPKFNSLTNTWIYSFTPIKHDTLFHQLSRQIIKEQFRDNFLSDEEFYQKMIIFSRYPFIACDLFKFQNENKVILIREPYDWIVSRYTQFEKNNFFKEGEINKKLIRDELNRLNKFLFYWKNNLRKNKDNYIIVKFEELVKESKEYIIKILNFLEYDVKNEDIIDKSIKINSKEFILKNLGVNFTGTRFKDKDAKKINSEKIKQYTEEIIKNLNIKQNYLDLIELNNSKI